MNLAFLELPRRSLNCHKCAQSLEKEEFCYSGYEEGQRRDYCPACWAVAGLVEKKDKSLVIYFWKTHTSKKNEKPVTLRKEVRALAYLKEIIGCSEKEEEQFFLSLYLMRKKMLQLKKEIEADGRTYQIFEAISTGEMLPIPKIALANLNYQRAQQQIAAQLKN